jgi:hypothetical protein
MILPRIGTWRERKGWFVWERMEHRDYTPSILCKVTLRDYAAEDSRDNTLRAARLQKEWSARPPAPRLNDA